MISCVDVHMGLDPSPVYMRPSEPDPSPFRVDVINGWSLYRGVRCMRQRLAILDLFQLKINLKINIGAKLGRLLPASGTMSFYKDVFLLLLFICCSYDVIFVAFDAKRSL